MTPLHDSAQRVGLPLTGGLDKNGSYSKVSCAGGGAVRRGIVFVSLGLMVATACRDGGGSADSVGDKPRVVTSFYPLAQIAERVGGSRVAVTNLTPAGSEPHDLELTPRDVDRIEDAGIVVYLGGRFQPAIESAAERAKGIALDVLNTDLGLIDGYENEEGDEGTDPHVWLDATLTKQIVQRVLTALVDLDPPNKAAYEADARAYEQELDALDGAYRQGLAECDRRVIVTSHAAFGYLARRYGLVQEAIAGLEPEAEPDAKRLSELTTKAKAEGTTTIFTETLVSPEVADTLAKEAGVRTAVLNPLEGLSDDERSRGETYLSVMRQNLETLRVALGCR